MVLLRVLSPLEIIVLSKIKGSADSIVVVDKLTGELHVRVIKDIKSFIENKKKNEREVRLSPLTVIADVLNTVGIKDKNNNEIVFEVKEFIAAPEIDILGLKVQEQRMTRLEYTVEGFNSYITVDCNKSDIRFNVNNNFISKEELKRMGIVIDIIYSRQMTVIITLDHFYNILTSYNEDKELESKVEEALLNIHL